MERSVKVRLELAVAGYQAAAARASASTKAIGTEVTQMSRKSRQEMQTVGTAAAVMGGAIAGTLALAGRSAIQFESSFAGVRKTVNASEPEFARLAAGMRDMSRSIPTNVNELNAIGESAGQLGIATENLLDFTRTMADLGETTNMSSDQAATSLARLANITQMPQTEFDRLGSTIVELGNNFATTESEITEMGLRLAGAGSQIGMTEAQILGMSTALTSVGINAEAGGSALSKIMIEIASEVENGGDKLATFASVSGQTVEQFSSQWEDDAAGALVSFITGLDKVEDQGGSTLGTLEDLEITEVRMRDALLRAAGAGDLLTRSMETGTQAFEDNNALAEEAAQRYETVEARLQIARNAFNDAGITIGQTFTPAVGGAADAAAGLFGAIADLPGPAAAGVTAVGALGGAASLAAGGFLLAAPRIVETKDALRTLSTQMPRTVSGLRSVSSVLTGPWGVALAGAAAAVGLFAYEQGQAARLAQSLTATLDDQTGALTDVSEAWLRDEVDKRDAAKSAELLGLSLRDVTEALMGNEDARRRVNAVIAEGLNGMGPEQDAARNLSATYNDLSAAVESSTSSRRRELENAARAKDTYVDMAHAIESGLLPAEASARREMNGFTSDTRDAAGASSGLAGSLGSLGGEFGGLTGDVEETVSALETYLDRTKRATDPVYALNAALEDVEEAQSAYTEAVDKHGPASEEAKAAALGLSSAISGAESAAIDGDLSFDAFSRKLSQWVSMGVMTADQANATRARVAELRGEAEAYEGGYLASIGMSGYGETLAQLENLAQAADRVGRDIHVNVSGTTIGGRTQHAGGFAGTGPIHTGPLKGDEVPAVLQTGEFVLSRDMVAALGILPRFHDGGPVGSTASQVGGIAKFALNDRSSEVLARGIRYIDEMVAEWEDGMRRAEEAATRADLVGAVGKAQQAVASATGADERARANERLADALAAVAEHDRDVAVAADKRAIAAQRARLATELEIAENREAWKFAKLSTADQIANLEERMASQRKFTDEWMALASQRQRLLDEQAEAEQRAADLAEQQAQRRADNEARWRFDHEMSTQEQIDDLDRRIASEVRFTDEWMQLTEQRMRLLDEQAEAERRATEQAAEQAQRRADNQDRWAFEHQMSTEQQIDDLDRRIAAEQQFTDEWVRLTEQRMRLVGQETDAAARATDSAVSRLNGMLDERRGLLDEAARAEADYTDAVADVHTRSGERVAQVRQAANDRIAQAEQAHADRVTAVHTGMAERITAVQARANGRITQLASTRADALRASMDFDDDEWNWQGHSLAVQLARQTADLQSWASELDRLRGRGVSEAVIDMLGLDRGPEALGQIRQLAGASQDELDRLNKQTMARERAIAAQVADERTDQTSALGAEIARLEQETADEVTEIQAQAQAELRQLRADHSAQVTEIEQGAAADVAQVRSDTHVKLAQMEADHHDRMREFAADLAAIGQDSGRSYAEAIAEGIASGIPAIAAQVAEVKRLIAEREAAERRASRRAALESQIRARFGDAPIATDRESASERVARIAGEIQSGQRDRDRVFELIGALSRRTYDSGGVLSPGLTLAYNGTGRDEYVVSDQQLAAMQPTQAPVANHRYYDVHVTPTQSTMDADELRRTMRRIELQHGG